MQVGTTFDAMKFAMTVHADQKRKYTNTPYFEHLAEVAGIVAAVRSDATSVSVAWLHDSVEDQNVSLDTLRDMFGDNVAFGVQCLTDVEVGNRKTRKALGLLRLAAAPAWVQTIKLADIISNTKSIVAHDPSFAKVYVRECLDLAQALTLGDADLRDIATQQLRNSLI